MVFFSFLIFHKFLNLEMVEKDECHDGLLVYDSVLVDKLDILVTTLSN